MKDDQSGSEKSGAYWFRISSAEFLAQTRGYKPSEIGVYVQLLAIMHMHGEPILDDPVRLARRVGTDLRTFRPVREALISAGHITEKDGFLWSPLIEHELEFFKRKSKIARKNAVIGHEKRKQNQRRNSADADNSKSYNTDIDSQTPSGSEKSYTSHTSDSDDDAPARDSAGSRPIAVNDRLSIPSLGECFVEKIVSVDPFSFLVYAHDDLGRHRACLVDRQLQYREISMNEADDLPDLSGEIDDRTA